MKSIIKLCLINILVILSLVSFGDEVSLKITKKYLNIPISKNADLEQMFFETDGVESPKFFIRLATKEPDYWIFYDVSKYRGKTLTIHYPVSREGLKMIYQNDVIAGQDSLYKEYNRPQFHFTTRRGWMNDPNGFVYFKGEYHMFYQHDPNDRKANWKQMYWGHAVSKDLIHWEELPIALSPERTGSSVCTGSAVIDYYNTTGFGNNDSSVMVLIYSEGGGQNLAYSSDNGRSFKRYSKNPVVSEGTDPHVFWHKKSSNWIMVVQNGDGNSIYTSPNLKDWQYQSHVSGFFECPQLFELPVDGNRQIKKWVMYGASGTYMIGEFDGLSFIPEAGKFYYCGGSLYAGQICGNIPTEDGRTIQVAWGRIEQSNMPFNQMILLPTDLKLQTTKDGMRLVSTPIREVEELHKSYNAWNSLSMLNANEVLKEFSSESLLRIKLKFRLTRANRAGLNLNGQSIIDYNMNFNQINGVFYSPEDPTSLELTADIFIDKTSFEVFIDNGKYSYSMQRKSKNNNSDGFEFWGQRCDLEVINMEVYTLKSIWQ